MRFLDIITKKSIKEHEAQQERVGQYNCDQLNGAKLG